MSIWLSTALGTTLSITASAPAIETFEYEIKKGDTCASIATAVYGHRKHHDVIHQYNRWLGAQLPHHLEPGQTLVLPKTLPPALPDAKVTAARRTVEARSPDTSDWSKAPPGLDLYRGWRVNTHERSSAEITFRDDSRIQMRESTLVIIYGGNREKARRETAEAQLDRGALRSRLGAYTGKSTRAVTVTTPSAVAQLEGGQSLVTVDEGGTSRVANHGGGKTSVRSSGKRGGKVLVKPKMGSRIDKGKAPTKPKPLPPTPAWLDRGPTTFAAAGKNGGTIWAEWGAIAGATSYRVEIAREPDGTDLVANRTVSAKKQRFEVQQLPAGDYYAAVAAIDDDAFESPPSERRKLSVVPVVLLTPGTAPLPDREGDEAATGPMPVLRGTRLDVPGDLRCSVDEGEPSSDPVLWAPGTHTIACVTPDGRPVPGFSVSVVEAKVAAAADRSTALRGQTVTASFSIDGVPLPRRVWVEAPEGFVVGPATPGDDNQWTVRVHADPSAPDTAQLRVMADAGGEEVELGLFELTIQDRPNELKTVVSPPAVDNKRERHMVEVGGFAGLMLPSGEHDLFQERYVDAAAYQRLGPAASSFGVRIGYYPIRWIGLELENGGGTTRTHVTNDRAGLYTIRGHVLGQLPGRLTPTLHVGAGILGISANQTLGRDSDTALHFGGGVKFYATRWAALRLDIRDIVTESVNGGVAHSPEVTFGISAVIGRTSAAKSQKARAKKAKRKREPAVTIEPDPVASERSPAGHAP